MRQVLTISLTKALSNEVDSFINEENMNRSELIREAVTDYIYFKKLKKLRNRMLMHSKKSNIFTDEDVFDLLS